MLGHARLTRMTEPCLRQRRESQLLWAPGYASRRAASMFAAFLGWLATAAAGAGGGDQVRTCDHPGRGTRPRGRFHAGAAQGVVRQGTGSGRVSDRPPPRVRTRTSPSRRPRPWRGRWRRRRLRLTHGNALKVGARDYPTAAASAALAMTRMGLGDRAVAHAAWPPASERRSCARWVRQADGSALRQSCHRKDCRCNSARRARQLSGCPHSQCRLRAQEPDKANAVTACGKA